jgi:hypothetical protein
MTLIALPQANAQSPKASIEGVWRVTRHGVNCQTGVQLSTFNALMSFAQGGSLGGNAVPPGQTPSMGGPEFGTWKREPGLDKYSFRFLANNYDANGIYSGTTEVAGDLTIDESGSAFMYTSTIKFFNASGGQLGAGCGAGTGTRF